MIRVTALYPYEEGAKFDHTYNLEKHIPMVKELLSPLGLVKVELDKGISAADPKAPAPFVAANHLFFKTVDEVHQAFIAAGKQVMGDIPNYTTIKPQIQISEIVE